MTKCDQSVWTDLEHNGVLENDHLCYNYRIYRFSIKLDKSWVPVPSKYRSFLTAVSSPPRRWRLWKLLQTLDLSCGFPWQFVTWWSYLPCVWSDPQVREMDRHGHLKASLSTEKFLYTGHSVNDQTTVSRLKTSYLHAHTFASNWQLSFLNCPSWISGRKRMTVDWFNNISYAIELDIMLWVCHLNLTDSPHTPLSFCL